MSKYMGLKKLFGLCLLSIVMVSNMIPYDQNIQDGQYSEVRVQSQNKSGGLDVGKAD